MSRVPSVVILSTLLLGAAAQASQPTLDEAISEHRRLAEEAPSPEILNDLANLLVLAHRPSEAASTYRRVLSLDPSDTRAQFNLGLLLQSQRQLDEALELFQAVLARHPDHAWAHYQVGKIFEAKSSSKEAIGAYSRALALDPELYFPDVNPQVVSNRLLTQALIEAARIRYTPSAAPMEFARPREITEMLLSLPAGDEDGGGTSPTESSGGN